MLEKEKNQANNCASNQQTTTPHWYTPRKTVMQLQNEALKTQLKSELWPQQCTKGDDLFDMQFKTKNKELKSDPLEEVSKPDPLPEFYKFKKGELTQEPARADRFNEGKLRYDLIPPYPLEQLAKLFTYGAKKYAPNNWKKGHPWSDVADSLIRHLEAYRAGEDYDYDKDCPGCIAGDCKNHSRAFHMTAVIWNAMILVDYYKSNPQFDDRIKSYLKLPKVVLDIDEVVCGWAQGYKDFTGKDIQSTYWDSRYGFTSELDELAKNKEFWLSLPVIRKPDFVPHAYVSSRSIPVEWTQEWLQKNELPCRPVYHVPFDTSKVEVLKSIGTEFFIDDRFSNFSEVQSAGICSFLMSAPHNLFYNVGYRRIYDLKLKNIIR